MKKESKGSNLSNKFNEILAKRKLEACIRQVAETATKSAIKEARALYDPAVKDVLFEILEIKKRLKEQKRVPVFMVLAVCCFFAVIFQPPEGEMLDIVLAFEFCLVASVLTHDAASWNLKFTKDRAKLNEREKTLERLEF